MTRDQDADRIALVIVDHGSRRTEANRTLEDFARRFARTGAFAIVEPAHMELAEPSIATAFHRCVRRGAARVVVVPYFLGPGKHWQHDIPALAAEAANEHPGVTWTVADPVGLHPLMIRIIADRAREALDRDP